MYLKQICLGIVDKKTRGCFHPPSQLTQSRINPLLMFWGWCIRPPFNKNKFGRYLFWITGRRIICHFPVRPMLKPERVVVIRIATVRATPVTHSLYLFDRARVVICGFPIPTDRAIHFMPHSQYPRLCVGTIPSQHNDTMKMFLKIITK